MNPTTEVRKPDVITTADYFKTLHYIAAPIAMKRTWKLAKEVPEYYKRPVATRYPKNLWVCRFPIVILKSGPCIQDTMYGSSNANKCAELGISHLGVLSCGHIKKATKIKELSRVGIHQRFSPWQTGYSS